MNSLTRKLFRGWRRSEFARCRKRKRRQLWRARRHEEAVKGRLFWDSPSRKRRWAWLKWKYRRKDRAVTIPVKFPMRLTKSDTGKVRGNRSTAWCTSIFCWSSTMSYFSSMHASSMWRHKRHMKSAFYHLLSCWRPYSCQTLLWDIMAWQEWCTSFSTRIWRKLWSQAHPLPSGDTRRWSNYSQFSSMLSLWAALHAAITATSASKTPKRRPNLPTWSPRR